jgi:hypothetical protein
MLVSFDGRWSICTPPKTGTMSLEATLRHRYPIAYQDQGRHGFDPPPHGERIMVVRHPYDRWWSMYWFMKRNKGFLHDAATDVNNFCRTWSEVTDHHWAYSQAHMADVYKPHIVCKSPDTVVEHLRSCYDSKIPEVSCTNVNSRKGFEVLSDDMLEMVMKLWVRPDCERFGYTCEF